MKIIRVPPYYPIVTWIAGTHGMEMIHIKRERIPDLVKALSQYVLDRGHGVRAFLV